MAGMLVPFGIGRGLGVAGLGTTLIAVGTLVFKNWGSVQTAINTGWSVKDCVMDNKIKAKRDDCLFAMNQFQTGIECLRDLNVSNRNSTRNSITEFMDQHRNLNQSNAVFDQLFSHVNDKTKYIWDSAELSTRTEMLKRLSPMVLDITNIPKSSSEIVGWVTEATTCTENRINAEEELKKSRGLRDIALKSLDDCRSSQMPLYERKGQCGDLESIKEQAKDLTKDSRKMLVIETELKFLKEKQSGLLKKEREYDALVADQNVLEGKFAQALSEKDALEKKVEKLRDKIKDLTAQKDSVQKEKEQCEKWFFTRWAGY